MRPLSKSQALFFVLVVLLFPAQVKSQDSIARPKIGLALSGGGAKGLAHLGVIKVMEEAGLRPDYITGVSMGSIIGGLYAMGYTTDSIAGLFRGANLDQMLSDRIPEYRVIFLEKKHFYNSLVSLPITREKILLPSGLIAGQQIDNLLSYYSWSAANVSNFSDLPIPFLCVGTNLLTGKAVLLTQGYLPEAIRASIAIPTLFTPVRIDSALLVDGGVVHNYAATELRDMGADIVIGSYVGFRRYTEQDLESAYGILKQIGFLTSLADYGEEKRKTDILIEPDMKGFSTLDFSHIDTIIERGYRAALPYKEKFRQLADSLNAIGTQPPLVPLPEIKYHVFDRIDVTGNNITSDEEILGVLDIRPGQKVGRDLLAERIELLYGKAWFEKVTYKIIPRNDSLLLEIDCIERPKAMIYGSLHYDIALNAGAVLSISIRDLVTQRSVVYAESYIGQYYRLRLGTIQFLDRSQKFGLEASFFMDNTLFPLIELRGETGPMLSQNYITSLSVSQRISLNHLMNLSFKFEATNLITDYISASHIERLTYDYVTIAYSYQANTLDTKHFPNEGVTYSVSASLSKLIRGALKTDTLRTDYNREDQGDFSFHHNFTFRGWFSAYWSPAPKLTWNVGGEALFFTDADTVSAQNSFFLLGGITPTTDRSVSAIGFYDNQIPLRSLAGVRLSADYELAKDFHISFGANLFAIQELDRDKGVSFIGGYGLGIGYMTIAGPIRLGVMHGLYDREVFYKAVKPYVSIGFTF
jgi:NTE family protein